MPDSPSTSFMRGWRSRTPEKIIDVRMFAMLIWNWVMFVANADRATARSIFGASGAAARVGSEPIIMILRMWSGT